MKLFFACEGRFTKKGEKIYCESGQFTYKLWSRYLKVFDSIIVVARVKQDEAYIENEVFVSNRDRVTFLELPYYVGPIEYLKVKKQIKKQIEDNIVTDATYLCRLPGTIGGHLVSALKKKNISYGVEVVGDPWDVFAPGAVKHPLRWLFRIKGTLNLKKLVRGSSSALYVTKQSLQKRYPTKDNIFTTYASNVDINSKDLPNTYSKWQKKDIYSLISVGSLAQMYKAPDVVINALSILKGKNIGVKLTWLGDGKYRYEMEKLAESLGLMNMIDFKGNVSSVEVRENLLDSDLFLLVSRTEGLPRAVVEAMAMGLPCIGSNVGGIPELLDQDAIVPKDDAKALASKIEQIITSESFFNQQAEKNYNEAKEYYNDILIEKREEFYRSLIRR